MNSVILRIQRSGGGGPSSHQETCPIPLNVSLFDSRGVFYKGEFGKNIDSSLESTDETVDLVNLPAG